jgi:hypothetical protein
MQEKWLTRLCLADLVCDKADLPQIIEQLAQGRSPAALSNVSIPVYAKGVKPVRAQPVDPVNTARQFTVEVGTKTVKVDGITVVAPQSTTRFLVFRILWDLFLEDLKSGLKLDDFRTLNVDNITDELGHRTSEFVDDVMKVRRTVNRLQTDIETTIKKKLGTPIDRQDIMQTCKCQGVSDDAYGYRINPSTVAARPFQPATRET